MTRFLILFSAALLTGASSFCVGGNRAPLATQHSTPTVLFAANKGPGNVSRPQNEFSRTFKTESVLGSKTRDYQTVIEASEDERAALATRFDLANILSLKSDLIMRREPGIKGTANRASGVEVEGNVMAKVTQTCVRTNEKFDVDLEFPVFAVVRPIAGVGGNDDDEDLSELEGYFEQELRSRKKGNKRKDKAVTTPERNVNEMDMMELQRMLQDFDVEDDVFEDENIYSSIDGKIDLGELVSQLFWLKLDPYPKKPGTYPIRTSITG